MHDWSQRVEAVQKMIDELRTCFANIRASAQSLAPKLRGDGENPIEDIEQIVRIAERTEEKLTCFSQTCALMAEISPTESHNLTGERLPGFAEYVCHKCGVELDEDLVTMIEDLIERQKQRVEAER